MAVSNITYADKVNLKTNSGVAAINKVSDTDMIRLHFL